MKARALEGEVALVTGANGGMGRACARQLGATTELVLTDASASLEALRGSWNWKVTRSARLSSEISAPPK